jgi:hypothetical protein
MLELQAMRSLFPASSHSDDTKNKKNNIHTNDDNVGNLFSLLRRGDDKSRKMLH